MNRQRKLLGLGIAGTVIAALCCFTPVLIILLGAVGLSGLLGYLDYALLPALAYFVGLTVYALYRNKGEQPKSDCCPATQQDGTNK
ncbi:Membrane protein [Vibrio jasicida]|uniref:Membrane protein n=1 Tax=Vibrio jasicida TaxID=766224 RepID=A0AAU9QKG1_9VIBR|nr:Membrane protein [Vibrio jasicida]CAH1596535.1 Membrane protein [Vibrio jasicida]